MSFNIWCNTCIIHKGILLEKLFMEIICSSIKSHNIERRELNKSNALRYTLAMLMRLFKEPYSVNCSAAYV